MSTNDAIVSLIDAAKRLRTIAEELGNVDVKVLISDVLVDLQEVRDQCPPEPPSRPESPPPPPPLQAVPEKPAEEVSASATPSPVLGEFTQEHARMESSGEIETYAFHLEEPEPQAEEKGNSDPTTTESKESEKKKSGKAKGKPANGAATDTKEEVAAAAELSDEERFAQAESRIADLEPLHQAALKRMNNVLTPEQSARKAAATKKGLAAGLKGKQLQEAVLAVLNLTEEQEQQLAKGRHELHQIRLAIAQQVKGLLSKDQLEQMLRSHRH